MSERQRLHPPARSEIHTADTEAVQHFLCESYGTAVQVEHDHDVAKGLDYCHSRTGVGLFATETIKQRGSVRTCAERFEPAVVYLPDKGRVECRVNDTVTVAGPGQMVLAQSTDGMVETRTTDVLLRSVVLDQSVLLDAAGSSGRAIRFTGHHPVDSDAARLFKQAALFVQNNVLRDGVKTTPLVIGAAGRLLASAALAAFANFAVGDADGDGVPVDATPSALRRAIDYIEESAHRDIGIADIAGSVYLTPRSVQYIFRKYMDTTPTEYLRTIRLARAHEDLAAADRSITTVAATAARWGFSHTGRFAVQYRQTYGESPHETLRRS